MERRRFLYSRALNLRKTGFLFFLWFSHTAFACAVYCFFVPFFERERKSIVQISRKKIENEFYFEYVSILYKKKLGVIDLSYACNKEKENFEFLTLGDVILHAIAIKTARRWKTSFELKLPYILYKMPPSLIAVGIRDGFGNLGTVRI